MKLSSLFAALVTLSILTLPTFAQTAVRPNPEVEAKAAQALLNAEIKLQKMIPLKAQQKPNYDLYGENFSEIAIAFARLGRTDSALKATQYLPSHSASETQSEVLRLSVRRSAILGDVQRAESLIPQIKNNNAKADALLTVARAYLRTYDYPAAQKVLFQVTPLVPKNFDALVYTAYLFAKSGNVDVSRRLFDRAKTMLSPLPDTFKIKLVDVIKGVPSKSHQILAFNSCVLDAGLVEEWKQFRKVIPKHSPNLLGLFSWQKLLQLGEVDLAIDIVRQFNSQAKMMYLTQIASRIAPKHPKKALSLMNEARVSIPSILQTLAEENRSSEDIAIVKQNCYISLAVGYDKLGMKHESQKWLQRLEDATPKNERAMVSLNYYMNEFSFALSSGNPNSKRPKLLAEVNKKIQPYLPGFVHDQITFDALAVFTMFQADVHQNPQAQSNAEFLEKYAKRKIASAAKKTDFDNVFMVARIWKRADNQKRCNALLQVIFDTPQNIPHFSKLERVRTMIEKGFVDAGLRFFRLLPKYGQKPSQSLLSKLPYKIAKAHPNQFRYELLKAKTPKEEASNLSGFARGLTNALFDTSNEQDFVLKSNGKGKGISAFGISLH